MRKLLFILLFIPFIAFSQQTYSTLTNYANTNIITGAAVKITGNVHNTMLNYLISSMGTREYDDTRPYTRNKSVVIYGGAMYRCKTTISSAEAWNAAKWQQLTDTLLLWSDNGTKINAYSTRNVGLRGAFTIGASASAPTGSIGLENNKPIYWLSTAPASTPILNYNASNEVELYGSKFKIASTGNITVGGGYIRGASYIDFTSGGVSTGVVRFANNTGMYWRNAANSANIAGLVIDASDIMSLNDGGATLAATGELSLYDTGLLNIGKYPATGGKINLENQAKINFRNAANSANIEALYTRSDTVYLTDKMYIEDTNIHLSGTLIKAAANMVLDDYDTISVAGINTLWFGSLYPDTVVIIQNAKANAEYTFVTKTSGRVTFENGGIFRMDSTITLDQYQSAKFIYDGTYFYLLNHR